MKKNIRQIVKLTTTFLMCISLLGVFSCKEKSTSETKAVSILSNDSESNNSNVNVESVNVQDVVDTSGFFAVDYTPLEGEAKPISLKLNAATPKAESGSSQSKERNIRDLKDYKTKYNTERKKYSDFNSNEESDKISAKDSKNAKKTGELSVLDWGPKGEIKAENIRPTFYVVFSDPVRALTALGDVTDKSDVMEITPSIKGVFRWLGTDQLSFEASEEANPAVVYTIKINENLTSISGQKISGNLNFQTKAVPIHIEELKGGSTSEKIYHYNFLRGIPEENARTSILKLNVKLSLSDCLEIISVKHNENDVKFSLKPVFNDIHNSSYDTERKITDTFEIAISSTEKIHKNNSVKVSVKKSKGSNNFETRFYETLKPFKINYVSKQVGHSTSEMTNPIEIRCSQIIDSKNIEKIASSIKIDKDGKKISVTKDNVKVVGSEIYIFNLPLNEFESNYSFYIDNKFSDIYGQKLADSYTTEIRVPEPKSYFNLADSGYKMLEWQFPHKIAFDYQNLLSGSKYQLSKISNPLYRRNYNESLNNAHYFADTPKNTKRIEALDLDPYLDEGFGFVEFVASTNTYYYYSDWRTNQIEKGETTNKHELTVQVTDLGVTVRIGINRVVVLVRSLSTNKPVENAEIRIYPLSSRERELPSYIDSNVAKTDKNGYAVISCNEYMMEIFEKTDYSIAVDVKNGKDRAIFYPDSHGYNWHSISSARKTTPRVFMFTDRGLYKPGETVSFRGIDKNQKLGQFFAYSNENFTVELKKSSWRDNTVYGKLSGTTSDSGGFSGKFDLPKDLEPGNYELCYKRHDDKSYYGTHTLYFQVAYFEPLKFQSSVSIPSMNYYAGDSINAKIEASYLAGGALSEADYEATWLRNPKKFSPQTAFASSYTFGPTDTYESANEIQQNRGKLSADGVANDSIQTTKTNLEVPYNYVFDSYVTDVSNQRISASTSVLVHSSRFYIGAKMNHSGFPKNKEKVEFSLILANVDGESASTDLVDGDLDVDFTRISWELTNMNGLNDDIYSRYEKVKNSVKKEKIKISSFKNGMGKISFTPEKSGSYILTVKGKDIFGNDVKTEYSFYVSGSDYYWWGNDSNELNLTADKNLYNPGEKAQILLSSPLESGDYLITVEREGIFTQEVKHFDSSCSVIEIPISRTYVPVVYVSVASYSVRTKTPTHQYGEKDTDKPKGYYGVTELFVNPYTRAFSISVESDKKVYRPGEEATIKIKTTKGGKPLGGAEITLMAVDRAILDLINYHVPNPIEFFYDKLHFANYVHGGDSRDMLMDPVTYAIKNLQGGDAEASEDKDQERKDFKPTALFEPCITTNDEGEAEVKFKLPDNLTTFRITAVGVNGELFGIQENEIGVRNPINVQSVQPRRLRVRDTAECGVLLTNLDNVKHSVNVSLSIRKPTSNYDSDDEQGLVTLPGEAFVDGSDTQTIEVPSGASYTVYFDVAAQKAGNVELVYTVKSDVLNEKLVSPVLIEKTYVYETVTMTGSTDDDKKASDSEFIQIPSWADDGEGSISVTLDATRLGMLSSSVNYVFEYPYGCIEQKTSKILPFVVFEKYIDVFGLDSKVKDIRQVVKSHFKFLKKYQHPDGGFGYWPSSIDSNLYVSLKVAQLCAYALEHGYSTSEINLDTEKLISFIEKDMSYRNSNTYKAYSYYVLSKLERYHDSEVASLYEKVKENDLVAMAYCGLYYQEQVKGDKSKAKEIADEIRKYLQISQRSVSIIQPDSDSYWSYFGNDTEQLALILKLFVQNDPKDVMVGKLVYSLLFSQKAGYWQNTATTASVLESIYTYIKVLNLDAVDFTAQAELMGIKLVDGKFEGAGAKPVTKTYSFKSAEISKLEKGKNLQMQFAKKGNGILYYTTELKYALPDELQNARDEGLKIAYQIIDSETGKVVEPNKDSKIIELKTGKVYKAKITLSSTKNRNYIALRSPIPSGAEILDANLATGGRDARSEEKDDWRYWISNKVLYDNEAHFFWDNFMHGSYTFDFKFRTSRRGVYPIPPVQAELMYEPEVLGRSDGYLFIIK